MSYHGKSQKSSWLTWKRENQDFVLASGLPGEFFESEQSWWYFLEHGTYRHWPPSENPLAGFKLESLTNQQRVALVKLIDATETAENSDVAQWLKRNTSNHQTSD